MAMAETNAHLNDTINSCSLMSPLDERVNGSQEIMEILCEMSSILKTDLDPECLAICFKLLENGVNAEALAKVVINLREQCVKCANSSANPFSDGLK